MAITTLAEGLTALAEAAAVTSFTSSAHAKNCATVWRSQKFEMQKIAVSGTDTQAQAHQALAWDREIARANASITAP